MSILGLGDMRKVLIAFVSLLLAATTTAHAAAAEGQEKVALVIGNSSYAHAVNLQNPAKDAKLMASTLRDAGFTVIEGTDLGKASMGELLDQFTEAAYDADVAVVYYAGHGLQADGQNYLIPVDAKLEKAAHLQSRTISVGYVLSKLPADPAISIVILDACRDNPLARSLAAALPKNRSSSIGSGLAAVQANGQSYGVGGLLIAYATDPGAVAYDGTQENSPYTAALARHLTTRGLEIQSALTRVRAEVSAATGGAQRPWHNASLAREVFLGGEEQIVEQPAPQPAEPPAQSIDSVEQTTWEEASKRNTTAHYDHYLLKFPDGKFAELARINLNQLKAAEAKASEAAPVATEVATLTLSRTPEVPADAHDQLRRTPGTPETEALLGLDKQGRIDLQLRLSTLGYETGSVDGSIGPRSRATIGAWQRDNGIVETSYLTAQQHLLLVSQTEPRMANARAKHEADTTASKKRHEAPEKKKKSETRRQPQLSKPKKQVSNTAAPEASSDVKKASSPQQNTKKVKQPTGGRAIVHCKKLKSSPVAYQGCLDRY